jgi:hypothetical protein
MQEDFGAGIRGVSGTVTLRLGPYLEMGPGLRRYDTERVAVTVNENKLKAAQAPFIRFPIGSNAPR